MTLAHSPDPDDVFMWWPLTGKIGVDGQRLPGAAGKPAIDTGRFEFRALPADIEVLNRRAAEKGDLEITAMSVRAWADVRERYAITACGASFGDGFGPKVVARASDGSVNCEACLRRPEVRIAIPGRRTTAFLMLGMVLGPRAAQVATKFVEMPFDQIIPAVAQHEVEAGLVIHEGQLTFGDAGLKLVIDVGQWWKTKTGLKLPLGINAVRRDLDQLYGMGTVKQTAALLRKSVAYAMERWEESVSYAMPFAAANAKKAGQETPTVERVDRYCRMYVSEETRDMGDAGLEAIRRLLAEGARAGLCAEVGEVDTV